MSTKSRMNEPKQPGRDELLKAVLLLRAKAHGKSQAYGCFLDEQPTEWVPQRSRQALEAVADNVELVVNSSFRCQSGADLPREVRDCAAPLEKFLRGHPIAWVEDPGSCIWAPFWARDEWAEVIQSLQPGLPEPFGLSSAVRRVLAMANILVTRGYEQARQTRWQEICQSAQSRYRSDGYAVVRDLLHPLQLGAMRRYYRALVAEGGLPLGDSQVAGRYRLHSEVIASFLHPQLAKLVSAIAGEPVRPSYVYFASYQPGADLPRHVDREQCEFSISLLTDYVPDPAGPCGWPLFMQNPGLPGAAHAADLGVGDGVFYRGRELIHYRHPLPAGHQSTSIFMHYVRADFAGKLW